MAYSFYFCNDFVHALTGTKTKHQDWEAALTLEALRGGGGGGGGIVKSFGTTVPCL